MKIGTLCVTHTPQGRHFFYKEWPQYMLLEHPRRPGWFLTETGEVIQLAVEHAKVVEPPPSLPLFDKDDA